MLYHYKVQVNQCLLPAWVVLRREAGLIESMSRLWTRRLTTELSRFLIHSELLNGLSPILTLILNLLLRVLNRKASCLSRYLATIDASVARQYPLRAPDGLGEGQAGDRARDNIAGIMVT